MTLPRKLWNYLAHHVWTPCRHENHIPAGYYSSYCPDCGAELGEQIRSQLILAEAARIRKEKGTPTRRKI